ncbi:MAG: LysR family transcriptional regulator [Rhizobiaceae bacterium]|nr:LysR family transcriptional regulator [Rhizobiaceae bacterium]
MLYNTLRQYEYIVAVAEQGSLTKAAALLHVSQPSLSVAITRVEQKLGQPIFVRRKGAAIEITPFGHRFIDKALGLLQMAGQMEDASEAERPFVLACFQDIAPWFLAPALKTLRSKFPSMAFEGREGRFAALATDLKEGRSDLAISYDIGFEDHFERRKIREISPVAFVSIDHPLSGESSVELQQLVEHPLILFAEDLSEGYVSKLFEDMGQRPLVAARTASLEMMRSLAAHGTGIGLSYSHPPAPTSYDGQPLVTLPISSPQAVADIVVVWSKLQRSDRQFENILSVVGSV